jgi:hypothetical protein
VEILKRLSNPKAVASLKQGLKEANAGKFYSFKDVFGEEQRQIPSKTARNSECPYFSIHEGNNHSRRVSVADSSSGNSLNESP